MSPNTTDQPPKEDVKPSPDDVIEETDSEDETDSSSQETDSEDDNDDDETKNDGKLLSPDKAEEESDSEDDDDENKKDGKLPSLDKETDSKDGDDEAKKDGKLPSPDEAEKETDSEYETDSSSQETDSEDDDDDETKKDGKLLSPDKAEEETDSEDDDDENKKDGKLPSLDKADEENSKDDDDLANKDGKLPSPDEAEIETDSKDDDDEDKKDGKLPSPDKADEETDSDEDDGEKDGKLPAPDKAEEPSHSLLRLVPIPNNVSDSGASPSSYIMQPSPKPVNIITEKRSHAEMIDGQQSSPKRTKKPKLNVMEKKTTSIPIAWSHDDEVTLLKGMADYKKKKGVDPKSNLPDFYKIIKAEFQVDCTTEQLRNKIRNLNRRFSANMNKRKNDSDPVFSKPHDCLVYDLSMKVWGDDEIFSNDHSKMLMLLPKANSKSNSGKEKKIPMDVSYNGESFWSKYFFLCDLFDEFSTDVSPEQFSKMKDTLSLIGDEVAKEIDDQCKQLFRDKLELKGKMTNLVMAILKMKK